MNSHRIDSYDHRRYKKRPASLAGLKITKMDRLVRSIVSTAVRLILLSLVVGLLFSFFHLNPPELLGSIVGRFREIADALEDLGRWSVPYILLGAEVVVPIGLVAVLFQVRRR
jgi:hypothetical protein